MLPVLPVAHDPVVVVGVADFFRFLNSISPPEKLLRFTSPLLAVANDVISPSLITIRGNKLFPGAIIAVGLVAPLVVIVGLAISIYNVFPSMMLPARLPLTKNVQSCSNRYDIEVG
jgi:hypothetical protein